MPGKNQQVNGFSVFSGEVRKQMRSRGQSIPDVKSEQWKDIVAEHWNVRILCFLIVKVTDVDKRMVFGWTIVFRDVRDMIDLIVFK